ncbi:MAG: hypothetical protein KGJ45_11090 [Elusimicrobia bacterium]|nr:hypothetical protein [Elusimicrobiota bacterium]
MKTSNDHRAISAVGVVIVLLLIIVAGAAIYYAIPPGTAVGPVTIKTTTTGTGPATNPNNVPGKIQFIINNPFSGATATPTTFKIYPASGSVVGGQTFGGKTPSETVSISSGSGTTADMYAPGTVLNVYEVLSGSETMYWQEVAPGVTPAMQAQGTAAQMNLGDPATPTVKITVVDDHGNSYVSGTSIANFTSSGHCTSNNFCLGETSITFTVTITTTSANSGYFSTFDPINNQNWCAAVQMKENGTDPNIIGVSGFPNSYGAFTVGSTRYWQETIPDGASTSTSNLITGGAFESAAEPNTCSQYTNASGGISTQTQGGQIVGGSVTYKFTATQGSLAHGNVLVLTPSVYQSYDPVYAAQNSGSGGATVAQLANAYFHLKIGA